VTSEETAQVVRDAYEAWNRGDLASAVRPTHADVKFVQDPRIPGAATLSGRDAVRSWLASFSETWEQFQLRLERVESVDNRILVLATIRAKGRLSEIEVEQRIGHLLTVRDGEIVDWQSFAEPHEAVEAAGLSE
jgi:ketosteroid isomerase-like protein